MRVGVQERKREGAKEEEKVERREGKTEIRDRRRAESRLVDTHFQNSFFFLLL